MRRFLYVLLGVLLVPTVGLVGDIVTDGTFKSTQPSGAPLEVASDDMVVNLNADMVDGVDGTDLYTKAEVDAMVAAAATADSRRRFYLTMADYQGADALTACDAGFHMASIWEILDVSNLRYDTARGQVLADSGGGPPQYVQGWVRTGDYSYAGNATGFSNCNAWTSSSGSHWGTSVDLPDPMIPAWEWDAAATRISPWKGYTVTCLSGRPVWCIED